MDARSVAHAALAPAGALQSRLSSLGADGDLRYRPSLPSLGGRRYYQNQMSSLFPEHEPLEGSRRTGYSVYTPDANARKKYNELAELYPALPSDQFDIVYADPPWDYGGKLQFDKSSKSASEIDFSRSIFISAANFKYPTLRLTELMKLQVQAIAKPDSLLFMWATNPHLDQALQLGHAWGFNYRTVAFVWDKMAHNPGKYTLSNCELCLLFKRGKIPTPRGARNVQQLIRAERGKHSQKPWQVREAITKMFPTQSRIELFARSGNPGWSQWGLESESGYNHMLSQAEVAGDIGRND